MWYWCTCFPILTYILSLAVNYSPDDVGFFIIDYKGGGMANLFEGLPHMIGQISNLSGNQVISYVLLFAHISATGYSSILSIPSISKNVIVFGISPPSSISAI